MPALQIQDVANYILALYPGIEHRKLQKLLYYVQGFHLAQTGEPLFSSTLQAWQHGPVSQAIWHAYKSYGYNPIEAPTHFDQEKIPKATKTFIAGVLAVMMLCSQTQLINYSHIDSPWADIFSAGMNREITQDSMKTYFASFTSPDEYVAYAEAKHAFTQLVDKRVIYLESLSYLGDDWISGASVAPSPSAIQTMHAALDLVKTAVSTSVAMQIPKIVMGPIPSGGVSLELHFDTGRKIFFNAYNDESMELEFEDYAGFHEIEVNPEVHQNELRNAIQRANANVAH